MSAVNSQALTVIEKGTCWEKPRLAQYRSYLLGMKETYSARCEKNFNELSACRSFRRTSRHFDSRATSTRILHNQENERLGAIPDEAWGENKE